jgi:hypothetical protein
LEGYKFKVSVIKSKFHEPSYIKLTKVENKQDLTEKEKFQDYFQWLEKIAHHEIDTSDVQSCCVTIGDMVLYLWLSNMGHCHSIRIYEKAN